MKKFLILVLMILLINPTICMSAEKELVLKITEKAPYTGVLIPESNYRFYQEEHRLNNYFKEMMPECVPTEHKIWLYFGLFFLGVTAGVAFTN